MPGKSLWIFVLVVAVLVAPALAQPVADIVIEHNVAMKTRDGVTLKADVYRPAGDGSFSRPAAAHALQQGQRLPTSRAKQSLAASWS